MFILVTNWDGRLVRIKKDTISDYGEHPVQDITKVCFISTIKDKHETNFWSVRQTIEQLDALLLE